MKIRKILTSKITLFIALAALLALGFLGFFHYRNTVFSKEVVRLEILGPATAAMGQEIEYTVKYKNNGNFALEQVKIIFELPEHSLTEDSKTRLVRDVPDVYPGDENFVKFKTRLLGKEGDLKVAKAGFQYVPRNLSARYESTTTFTTAIAEVPIALEFDLPGKVEQNKQMEYAINYFSNVDYPLENLSIKVETTGGFIVEESNPPSLDDIEWKLETLEKSKGGKITIKGTATGQANSRLAFLARLGMRIGGTFVAVKEATYETKIIQPELLISQQINGSSHYAASFGETLNYKVFVRNIGATPLPNVFAVARLSGEAFDFATLQSAAGQARPGDRLVAWDGRQVPGLGILNPEQEAVLEFSIKLKEAPPSGGPQPAEALVRNSVTAMDVKQEFETKVTAPAPPVNLLEDLLGQ